MTTGLIGRQVEILYCIGIYTKIYRCEDEGIFHMNSSNLLAARTIKKIRFTEHKLEFDMNGYQNLVINLDKLNNKQEKNCRNE